MTKNFTILLADIEGKLDEMWIAGDISSYKKDKIMKILRNEE